MKSDVAKSTNIRQNACRWRMIYTTHIKTKLYKAITKRKGIIYSFIGRKSHMTRTLQFVELLTNEITV